MVELAAVVPATKNPPTLAACLAAIRAAENPPRQVIVVREPADAGPAALRNAGVRDAAADVIVFIDADVEVHTDAFSRIRGAFEADPGLSAVFGSYDDSPTAAGVVSRFRNLLHHHVHTSSAGPATTFWAGLGAIRREVFLSVGGFDEHRFRTPSIEDVELGMRLAARGARIRLDPELRGTHAKRWTLWEMVRTDFLARGVPWVALLLRSRSTSTTLNLSWRNRLSAAVCLAGVVSAARRKPSGVAAAIIALVGLNRSFYGLLVRRRGPLEAGLGVALHALHHLTSVAAVPFGAAAHLLERERGGSTGPTGDPQSRA
jgi:GT2 family glycosyltransferase